MPINERSVEEMAPDQVSLSAAAKLLKPGHWLRREQSAETGLIWGECQGSGANPYRVIGDVKDSGYKCNCPSRKFPCKHTLALFWMFARAPGDFSENTTPEWVAEWMGRRKKGGVKPGAPGGPAPTKDLAQAEEESHRAAEEPHDAEEHARKIIAARRRQEQARERLLAGIDDLENWIWDQQRLGLSHLLKDAPYICRKIAARMVDAGATALAGRIDELPAGLMRMPGELRTAFAVMEMGKWLLLARLFRAAPDDPAARTDIVRAMNRNELLERPDTLSASGRWEVVAERMLTQRDGLVRQSAWFLRLSAEAPRFALLVDHYPASAGKRAPAFTAGTQLEATFTYHPSPSPLRAILVQGTPITSGFRPWPEQGASPWENVAKAFNQCPWMECIPLCLPQGRIGLTDRGLARWSALDRATEIPLEEPPPLALLGMDLQQSVVLWNGCQAQLLAASTNLGKCHLP